MHPFELPFFSCSNEGFKDTDVIVDPDSVMAARQNTALDITVNEPGTNIPVSANIVEDALYQSIQENNTTDVTSLRLALEDTPVVSDFERRNALSVRLPNTSANEVSCENIYNSVKIRFILWGLLFKARSIKLKPWISLKYQTTLLY